MIIFDYFLLLICLLVVVFLLIEFYNITFRGYAPFIPTGNKAISAAVENISLPETGTVYELGCGQAGFLRELRKKYAKANLYGVEYNLFPYLIGQIQNSLSKSNIQFIKKNFFKVDLSQADAIYCFLSIRTMADLEPKFKAECKPGTKIISYNFTLPNHTPEKVVEMENKNKIYFYKI